MADLSSISSGFEVTTQEGFNTTLNGGIGESATTISLSSLAGYTDGDKVILTIDRVDDLGAATPSKEQVYYGEVQGNNLINCVSTEGTDQEHDDGAVVEDITTASHYEIRKKLTEQEHNADGTHSDITADSIDVSGDALVSGALDVDTIDEATEDNGVSVDGFKIKDSGPAEWGGWQVADESWSFSSFDSDTRVGVITVPTNATTKYSEGMKVSFSQSTGGTKYGFVVAVTSTSLSVFFGLDYTLNNEAISSPVYSSGYAPLGYDGPILTLEAYQTADGTNSMRWTFKQHGWNFLQGNATNNVSETITLPIKYAGVPVVSASPAGALGGSDPSTIGDLVTPITNNTYMCDAATPTVSNFVVSLVRESGATFGGSSRYGYSWEAKGPVA